MTESFFPTWRDRALCREADPEAWFPPRGGDPRPAKRICARCPVRAACLDYAMDRDDCGIWGGLSAKERRHLRLNGRHLAPVIPLTPVTPSKREEAA